MHNKNCFQNFQTNLHAAARDHQLFWSLQKPDPSMPSLSANIRCLISTKYFVPNKFDILIFFRELIQLFFAPSKVQVLAIHTVSHTIIHCKHSRDICSLICAAKLVFKSAPKWKHNIKSFTIRIFEHLCGTSFRKQIIHMTTPPWPFKVLSKIRFYKALLKVWEMPIY